MKHLILAGLTLLWASASGAAELGDDGLHKATWMHDTFKDLREDLADATAEGKRLALIIEQRGCIYCTRMHETVFPDPTIDALLNDRFYVVQINMFGDVEVTDFDGEALAEKDIVQKWGALFTPTMMFFPEEVPEGVSAQQAAAAIMPGAFEKATTRYMLEWVLEEGYQTDEPFQKYLARRFAEQ
ncbi:thioredoxin family protein [Tropicimonas sp. S265A]|uniref:thioredoxin family protein n=1 Tax=Tropicimonas sp. S265A TaxID=3415134 RepID=UPI003C7DB271